MAIDIHTVTLLANTALARLDRVLLGVQAGVANAAGASAGAAVTTAVTFAGGLPATYSVVVTPEPGRHRLRDRENPVGLQRRPRPAPGRQHARGRHVRRAGRRMTQKKQKPPVIAEDTSAATPNPEAIPAEIGYQRPHRSKSRKRWK